VADKKERIKKPVKPLTKLVYAIAIFILALIFILGFISKNNAVQNWYAAKLSEYLTTRSGGYAITLGVTEASLIKGIKVHDLNIRDLENNVMLNARTIQTSLRKNLFSVIFQNKVNLEDIIIENGQLNVRQYENDSINNLARFISNLSTKSGSEKVCNPLDIRRLSVNQFNFSYSIKDGEQLELELEQSRFIFGKLDLCEQILVMEEIFIGGGDFELAISEPEGKSSGLARKGFVPADTFDINVKHLLVDHSKIKYSNNRNTHRYTDKGSINFNSLDLSEFDFEAREIHFNNFYEGMFRIEHAGFQEKSGFQLERMVVDHVEFSNKEIDLKDVIVQSNGSLIKNQINLSFDGYRSFLDFNNEVYLQSSFSNCSIRTAELFYFAPQLAHNDFFRDNANKNISLNGRFYGKINNLKGNDIDLVFGERTKVIGSFSSRNLTIPGEELMNIRLESLTSNTYTLDKLLPGTHFSKSAHTLGELKFTGSFDGYFHDFVAYGDLRTQLGSMNMDMRLNFSSGISESEFSGNFDLKNFQLGRMLDNQDIGQIDLSTKIRDGHGLSINTLRADVDAKIHSLGYKGHTYKNFIMDGYLEKNLFNGNFSIYEEFIKFNLSGLIDYGDSIPKYNFDAHISHLDLANLNISKTPLKVKSDLRIDLTGNTFDNLSGHFIAKNIILDNNEKRIELDSVLIASKVNSRGERLIDLSSEVISFYFDGIYKLQEIPDAIIDVAKKNHPKLTKTIPYLRQTANNPPYYYDFYIYIPDSKTLFEIVQAMPASVKEMTISGHIDHSLEIMEINSSIDSLLLGNIQFSNFNSEISLQGESGNITLNGEKLKYNNIETDSLYFDASLYKNQLNYNLKIDTLDDKFRSVAISAMITPHEKGFETEITNGKIEILEDNWYIKNNNKIIIGEKYIDIENFGLINNLNSLVLKDVNNNQGIKAIISGFNMELINPFLVNNKLEFGGRAEGRILIPELFSNPVFEGEISVDELLVNSQDYGKLYSQVQMDNDIKGKINFSGSLDNNIHRIDFNGDYDTKARLFNSNYHLDKFPIAFLEHLLPDLISKTKGYGIGDLSISGYVGNMIVDGEATIYDCETKINYLGTKYFANNQKVKVTSELIDFTGLVLTDDLGNTANVTGGLQHTLFNHLAIDLSIKSDKIKSLSTTKLENPLYYGQGIGAVNVNFKGPVEKIDISINAEAFKGSKLTIPVRYETEVSQQSFIKFTSSEQFKKDELEKAGTELTGINLDMNLSIRPGAEVKIILDEKAGDNIQGIGTGDIRLEITRTGGFEMYGNYFIDEGTYLFTALTLIQKPFSIRKGGRITWNGDPLDAQIDLLADYKGERVSLDNFIQEYTINNPILAEKARKRTDVDLLLNLTGSLLHPAVSFDLNFPNLDGEIKSYAFSKLQKLRTDQNLMYTQAITLLSLGAFLPQDNLNELVSNEGGLSTAAAGLHTGLQYSAVLISKYLSGLFDELFSNTSWISGVDIDLNVINSQALGIQQQNIWPNEYTYDAKLHLFEDKASVELSGSYVNRGTISDKSYANGDFIFKYYFSEDRKLRIEAYSKREFDEFFNAWKWKVGTGLNYQLEFGSIYDMKEDLKRDFEMISDPPPPLK